MTDTTTETSDDVRARRRIAEAVREARREERRVLVLFEADWCSDSRALRQALEHPLVAPLLELGLEVVRLDVGDRRRHAAIARPWGIELADGIPAAALLDGTGELVTATTGGELASAGTMSPIEIATLVHRWLPPGAKEAG